MTFEYFIPILFDTAFFVQAIDFYFKMLSETAFNLGMNPEAIIFSLAWLLIKYFTIRESSFFSIYGPQLKRIVSPQILNPTCQNFASNSQF